MQRLFAILILFSGAATAQTAVEAIAAHKHMGVASCSNSVCHGASQPFRDSDVMQNEFAIWQEFDPHAKAYQILEQPRAKAIAQKLGLGDPTQATVCLDCHSDNVAASNRGERFQISDGVGCESCHGGSEQWLSAHADRKVAHADNLAKGMYATEDPIKRAHLCLSCHMGEKERRSRASDVASALSFEPTLYLAASALQDRRQMDQAQGRLERRLRLGGRAGRGGGKSRRCAARSESRLAGDLPRTRAVQLQACRARRTTAGDRVRAQGGAGAVRLNDANLVMFRHVLAPVDKAAAQRVRGNAQHRATGQSRRHVRCRTQTARHARRAVAEGRGIRLAREPRSDSSSMLSDAERGEFRDYACGGTGSDGIAVGSWRSSAGKLDKDKAAALHARLDRVYDAVKDEDGYSMTQFVAALKDLRSAAP